MYAGNESGQVVELSHKCVPRAAAIQPLTSLRSGDLQRVFKLPEGVKCIVGDGPFLYAGCNDGSLYDLTSGVPRLLSKLEAFSEVYWLDIKHGMLAASDSGGNVALVNSEGALSVRSCVCVVRVSACACTGERALLQRCISLLCGIR